MSGRLAVVARVIIALALALPVIMGTAPDAARARGGSTLPRDGSNLPISEESRPRSRDLSGPVSLMLEMAESPAAATYTTATAQGASEADAGQQAQAQKARNDQAQGQTVAALQAAVPAARVIYRVQTAYNGIAVRADVGAIGQLQALPGVKAVHVIPLLTPDNAASVPLIGAPQVWSNVGGTGDGITIGIIDTGIDYTHANFGGPGTVPAYDNAKAVGNNPTGTPPPPVPGGIFPTTRVVGGYDFAGDAYDANAEATSTPRPDRNPLDCNGHGSHVAGTAAGGGVTAAGASYAGPYSTSTPFGTMRIGPGVAPRADLYALKVFGCTGSTDLTTQAIEWATDPNGDGDPADHLDVINMSLGSPYGTKANPSAVAAEQAAALGVIVVTSAGNSGDAAYDSGSPGSAPRTIAVASSTKDDTVSTFSARGPRGGDGGLKPDIAAPGQAIFSTDLGTGTEGTSLNGTSMAAPHVAGVVALLRKQHPTWTVEEIKALAMNTADRDLTTGAGQTGTVYSPQRVGAGRVDVPAAMVNTVVAYADGGGGEVGVSFGALEVVGTLTQARTIRVANKGAQAATYTVGYQARSAVPGVAYDFPDGNTVNVPANGSATFVVRLTATASAMTNAHDPTLAETQLGNARQWLNEASGLVTLTPVGNQPGAQGALRVPVYAAARPASQMATAQGQLVFPHGTGAATLDLTGQGVSSGAPSKERHTSIVTALELAATSGPLDLPAGSAHSARAADLKAIGVGTARRDANNPSRINNSTLYFGLATHGNWSTPATEVEFDIYIDVDRDGTDDYVLFTSRLISGSQQSDVLVTTLNDLNPSTTVARTYTNGFSPQVMPTAIFNSNVLVLPIGVTGGANGLTLGGPGNTRFNYQVVTFDRSSDGVVDQSPVLTYDYANPGLDFATDPTANSTTSLDLPGETLAATMNQAAYVANGSEGALLLHHYNATGARDQIVPVRLVRTIAFTPPANKTLGDAPFAVSATITPSGTPTITSLTTGVCTIGAGNTVTLVAAGNCTLRAAVADDGTYQAASVDATIAVAPAPGASPSPSPSASPSASPTPSPSPSTGPAPSFADVPIGYWAHDQIGQFAARGITTGCGEDEQGRRLYCPERGVTRAEMATFLTRAVGQDKQTPPATPTFADVPTDYWAYGQIEAFVRLGITTGCGLNELGQRIFCPDRGVTRAEMAAFLDRAQGQAELAPGTPTFADVPPSYWAYGWIERFFTLGVTTGCGTDEQGRKVFCPDRGVTRAEMAVFIIRAYP